MNQDETAFVRPKGFKQVGDRVFDGEHEVTPFVAEVGRAVVQVDPSHEAALIEQGGKLATAATWVRYSSRPAAQLWRAIALLCFADPAGWSVPEMRQVPFCRSRLNAALAELNRDRGGWLQVEASDVADEPANTIVEFDRVRNWARKMLLPVPMLYPDPRGSASAGKPARAVVAATHGQEAAARASKGESTPKSRTKRARSDAFMRKQEVADFAGFSVATLWRRIKDGSFPEPVDSSDGYASWSRERVEAWAKERSVPPQPAGASKPGKRRTVT